MLQKSLKYPFTLISASAGFGKTMLLSAWGQALPASTALVACFNEVKDVQFPDETIQNVTARTEGWLVGLQLLALSLQGRADPSSLLEEASGDQRYIYSSSQVFLLGCR